MFLSPFMRSRVTPNKTGFCSADVAGVLAVNVFPVLYIPLWLAVPAHPLVEFVLSAIPIVGQSVFYARAGRLPLRQTFFVVVLLTIVLIPACVAYLYFCRNRNAKLEQRRVDPQTQLRRNPSREELVVGGAAPPPRRGQRRQIHVLKLWLYALALVLFFGGWLAWKNDLNGTWCFRRDSPLYWLQGHAVWHVLTMGALGCIYWFFRSERLVE